MTPFNIRKDWGILGKVTVFIPYLVLLSLLTFIALRIVAIRSDATDIAGIEQNVIYSTQVLLDGGNLYQSPGVAPFSITQYTPVFYYLCGYTASLMGFGADDVETLYVIGRSWNLLFNLVTAWLVFKIGFSLLSLSKSESYILFLLSFVCTFSHNFAARPDSLQDMTAMASLYTFLLYVNHFANDKRKFLLMGITVMLTAISVFTKQSGIQMIIIFGGICLLTADWRGLTTLILFSIVIYGSFLFFFNSKYPFFLDNVIGGIANGISIAYFWELVVGRKLFVVAGWPLILAFLYLLLKRNPLFKGDVKVRALSIATLGTLVFASVTALKIGATSQYYVLFINLALLLLLKMQHYGSTKTMSNAFSDVPIPAHILVYTVLVVLAFGATNIKLIRDMDYDERLSAQRSAANGVVNYLQSEIKTPSEKYIFANLTTNYYATSRQNLNNVFFRQCLVPQMDILEYSAEPLGVMGYGVMKSLLENGDVEFIVASVPPNGYAVLSDLEDIVAQKFTLVKEIDGYQVYKFSLND